MSSSQNVGEKGNGHLYLPLRTISLLPLKRGKWGGDGEVGAHPGPPWQGPAPSTALHPSQQRFCSSCVPGKWSLVTALWTDCSRLAISVKHGNKPQEEAVQNVLLLFQEEFIFTWHFLYLLWMSSHEEVRDKLKRYLLNYQVIATLSGPCFFCPPLSYISFYPSSRGFERISKHWSQWVPEMREELRSREKKQTKTHLKVQ